MSEYAATNQEELFAESFAMFTHPNYKTGTLPIEIEEFLSEALNNDT